MSFHSDTKAPELCIDSSYRKQDKDWFDQLIKRINSCQHLTSLTLRNLELNDAQLKAITAALTPHRHLQSITLQGNSFSANGMSTLINYINHSTVQVLNLSRCHLDNRAFTSVTTQLQSKQLRKLSLSHNKISKSCANSVARLLQKNHQLRHINLAGNPLEPREKVTLIQTVNKTTPDRRFMLQLRASKKHHTKDETVVKFLETNWNIRIPTETLRYKTDVFGYNKMPSISPGNRLNNTPRCEAT